MGHDLSLPFRMVKNGWRAVYQPAARASEKMVPLDRGRVGAQAADDVPRLADRRPGRPADPRGYPPLYALMIASHRLLRYGTPLLHVLRRWPRSRCSAAAASTRPRPPRRPRCSPPRRRRPEPREAAARRPLLRADDGRAGRRPLRLAAPRHHGGLGSAGGHPLNRVPALPRASARWTSPSPAPLLVVTAPVVGARRARGPARVARPPDLPAAPRRPSTATRSRSTSCARWSPAPSTWARGWPSTRATRGSRGSARSCGARRSTSCRTCVNILRGEMSLVGPRPTIQVQVDQYTDRQRRRLDVARA